jgi:hypothetical protein
VTLQTQTSLWKIAAKLRDSLKHKTISEKVKLPLLLVDHQLRKSTGTERTTTMTSTVNALPLDAAVDTNVNVDDIDTEIAESIVGSEVVKDEHGIDDDPISTSGLIVRDNIVESKAPAPTTKNTPTDTAKSLNESNNKIIKELDDETAKTFPQIVS